MKKANLRESLLLRSQFSYYRNWIFDGKCKCGFSVACPRCIQIYEQGKKDADKLMDKEVEEIKQFCYNDGVDSGRIATLEEVLKRVKQMRVNWGSQKVLVLLSKWLEQQLKEAKG